jgi:tape measure domain-containing protein
MSALEKLAAQAQDYQQLYSTGQLSASEFKELVENLKVVEQIQNDANDFERDQQLREIIVGILTVASAIVPV